MFSVATAIIQALAHVSLVDAAAFVRRCIALWGAASQRARRAISALILAIKPANDEANDGSMCTRLYTIRYVPKRSKTTFFAMEREVVHWRTDVVDHGDGRVQCIATPAYAERAPRAPLETFFPEYETIETTQVLDVAKLLAQKYVRSVSCDVSTKSNTKSSKAMVTSDDETTASESDEDGEGVVETRDVYMAEEERAEAGQDSSSDEGEDEQDDDQAVLGTPVVMPQEWETISPESFTSDTVFDWTIGVYQSAFGMPSAIGSVLLQRRLLGV